MNSCIVVGLGEVGRPIYSLFAKVNPTGTWGYDTGCNEKLYPYFKGESPLLVDFLHLCIPWSADFVKEAKKYQQTYNPKITIVHSTVPIGTTSKLKNAVHSPVMGRHDNMEESISRTTKWIGGELARDAEAQFRLINVRCRLLPTSEETEALKLLSLAKYGMSIAFAQYQQNICSKYGFRYENIVEWDQEYNRAVRPGLQRPILWPPGEEIGGHCVVPGAKILFSQEPNPIIGEVLKYEKRGKFQAWQPCNIYPSAKIGEEVNIGAFTEIGPNVRIGDRVRIGAMCFVPEGVTIEDDAWIGPRVTFSNDKYPPSGKESWQQTVVRKGARIGAGVCILPGVEIGEKALVGMGAVVTRNIQAGAKVIGNPAREVDNSGLGPEGKTG